MYTSIMTTPAIIALLCIALLFSPINQAASLQWLSQPGIDLDGLADHEADEVRISANGRFISFVSKATNLVNNDNNFNEDLFIRDMQSGVTSLVSVTAAGTQASTARITRFSRPTSDGRYVAFVSEAAEFPSASNNEAHLYLKDLVTGTLYNESQFGTNQTFEVNAGQLFLSDDGMSIMFSTSDAIDPLHVGENDRQVYRKDLSDDSYLLLSTSWDGSSVAEARTELEHASSNGRYVVMASFAENLTDDAINNFGENFFLLDRLDDSRTLLNRTPAGLSSSESNNASAQARVSNLGQVVFRSEQSDLVTNDNNNRADVFFYDGASLIRINLDANGDELTNNSTLNQVAISGNGSRVAFTEYSDEILPADSNGLFDLYTYDTNTGAISLVSQNVLGNKANGSSYDPVLNDSGNRLVFTSLATDLTSDAAYAGNQSIFHYNFNSGVMQQEHVAVFAPQTIINDISHVRSNGDQSVVVFSSQSPNLIFEPLNNTLDLFVWEADGQLLSRIAANINSYEPDVSTSGRYITFRSKFMPPEGLVELSQYEVFRYDRESNTFLSIAEGLNHRVHDDGVVVFDSFEDIAVNDNNGLRDLYAYNPNNGQLVLISENLNDEASGIQDFNIGGGSGEVWVSFTSDDDNLVANDTNTATDVFLKLLGGGLDLIRISQTATGTEANGDSDDPAVSADGRWVAFVTQADNLTNDDYTAAYNRQVLLYHRINDNHQLVSLNQAGVPLTDEKTSGIQKVSVSDQGRFVAYVFKDENQDESGEGNDINQRGPVAPEFPGDEDGHNDVVLFDTSLQTATIVSKFTNGQHALDAVSTEVQVRSNPQDETASVGVVFVADHGSLTGLSSHPGHQEAYLYQQPLLDPDVIFEDGFD